MTVEAVEKQFIARARRLTEEGQRLSAADSLAELDRWDAAVNRLLKDINEALASGLTSHTLKYQLEFLTELYVSILNRITQLQQQKDDDAATLRDLKRRANTR